MRAPLAVLFISACGFSSHPVVPSDAPGDLTGGEQPGDNCFGSLVKVCLQTPPSDMLMFNADTAINTDTAACAPTTNSDAAGYCVLAGKGIAVMGGHELDVQGGKPIVFVSTMGIDVVGTIDVSSNQDAMPQAVGAGAQPTCAGTTAPTAGGGGFGGTFNGKGASGESAQGTGGMAGTPTGVPPTLRGGCPGGKGGNTTGGAPGAGGGAVALIAAMMIDVDGVIDASGGGGGGGSSGGPSGGGGGGAGGMIVLDAQTIMVMGPSRIFANGGAGGQGGSGPDPGAAGGDSLGPDMAAVRGGVGSSAVGGTGGDGSFGTGHPDGSPPTGNATMSGGGGAGGGGSGFIRATGSLAGMVAPNPS